MFNSLKKLLPVGVASVVLLQGGGVAFAGNYDALCSGLKCKIVLDGKGITGPSGFMPSYKIAQWYTGGGAEHNKGAAAVGAGGGAVGGAVLGGLATCWTIVLCGPGIIAGGAAGGVGGAQLGKSADFYFTVVGYDQRGQKTIQTFNFINKKPVGKIMQELPVVTGLAMGELRSVKEIKEATKREAKTGSWREYLPMNLGNPRGATKRTLPDSL